MPSIIIAFTVLCCSPPAVNKARGTAAADSSITATIGLAGGEITLPGYARVTFARASFEQPRTIVLAASSARETEEIFEATVAIHRTVRAESQVRIRTGIDCPGRGVEVELQVPRSLSVPPGHVPRIFALMFQSGGEELLDGFEPITGSVYHEATRSVTGSLPPEAFTTLRRSDRECEAVLVIATVPRP